MRRVLAAVAALVLSLPMAAAAQDHRERGEGRGGPRANAQAPASQARAPQAPAPQAAAPRAPAPQAQAPREGRGGGFMGVPGGRTNQARPALSEAAPNVAQDRARGQERDRGRPNAAQPAPAPNVAQERGRQGSNFAENRDRGRDVDNRDRGRDFGNRDRGRDFRGDRDRDRGARFFNFRGRQYAAMRAPDYHYPRGWGYRHWGRGEFLPSIFLAAPFFFDYDWLGLPPPPPGARWVRNGPDAILVSVYDDRILDVIYDAFY